MNQPATNPYLRTKIMTASPEELRLMLFDGAIKFARQARQALEKKDYENSYNHLMRSQKIVLELSTSLNPEIEPELCQRLSALYTYIYRVLVEANMERDPARVDQAIELLQYERETWQMLIQKVHETGRPAEQPQALDGARQTAISTYSA